MVGAADSSIRRCWPGLVHNVSFWRFGRVVTEAQPMVENEVGPGVRFQVSSPAAKYMAGHSSLRGLHFPGRRLRDFQQPGPYCWTHRSADSMGDVDRASL